MTQAISTKNFVLVLNDRSKLFLDEKEADAVKEHLRKGTEWLEIGDSMLHKTEIKRIITGGEYAESERIKRGDFKCKCGNWIPRGFNCGYCQL